MSGLQRAPDEGLLCGAVWRCEAAGAAVLVQSAPVQYHCCLCHKLCASIHHGSVYVVSCVLSHIAGCSTASWCTQLSRKTARLCGPSLKRAKNILLQQGACSLACLQTFWGEGLTLHFTTHPWVGVGELHRCARAARDAPHALQPSVLLK